MKRFCRFLFILIVLLAGAYYFLPPTIDPIKNGEIVLRPAKKKNYQSVQTKLAGPKNYPIYRNVAQTGGIAKIGSTKDFRHGLLQSLQSAHTKKGTFWLLNVDGRQVGWVNQKFFLRSKIALCQHISLVRNPNDRFSVKEALAYVVNQEGTLIKPSKVKLMPRTISFSNAGRFLVKACYHHLHAQAIVQIRSGLNEGVTVAKRAPAPGPAPVKTFAGSSPSSSPHWNVANGYQPESKINLYRGSHHSSLKTRFYQPRFHPLNEEAATSQLNQVGVIPEGIALNNQHLLVSYFSQPDANWGHLVTYDLSKLNNPLLTQNLLTMPWSSFKKVSHAISVFPYLKLGHGQSLGITKHYLYVLANPDRFGNPASSQTLLQISRTSEQITHLWTFKVWNRSAFYPRYFHNAEIVNSHLIYAVFHNASKGCYEYWQLIRQGNSWQAKELAATQSNFVNNNSPLQAFLFLHHHFYLAFNDNLFVVKKSGLVKRHYHFHTLRETEGIAAQKKKLYLELAKRPELLKLQG